MNTPQSRIEQLAASCVEQLVNIARDEVMGMLGSVGTSSTKRVSTKSNGAKTTSRRSKGTKRDPKDLEALQNKVLAFIKKNPGLRIEQINKELGTTTKDLQLPVRKLLADKAIKATGK